MTGGTRGGCEGGEGGKGVATGERGRMNGKMKNVGGFLLRTGVGGIRRRGEEMYGLGAGGRREEKDGTK